MRVLTICRAFRSCSIGIALLFTRIPSAEAQYITTLLSPGRGFSDLGQNQAGVQNLIGYGIGTATHQQPHALLWTDPTRYMALPVPGYETLVAFGPRTTYSHAASSALSQNGTVTFVDLNPKGFTSSFATATFGALQVGYGAGSTTQFNDHALLWAGTAASALDLHQFLAPGFARSIAVSVSANGDVLGYAQNSTGSSQRVLWTRTAAANSPEPGSALYLVAFVLTCGLAWRRRAGKSSGRPATRQD